MKELSQTMEFGQFGLMAYNIGFIKAFQEVEVEKDGEIGYDSNPMRRETY